MNSIIQSSKLLVLAVGLSSVFSGRLPAAETSPAPETNSPPVVRLVSPTNGTVTATGVTLIAEATDAQGEVDKVSFYANDEFLGVVKEPPFKLEWEHVKAGRYALFARATDSDGVSSLSQVVHLLASNSVPTVKITTPTNGAVFSVSTPIRIDAEATDADGSITKVRFFDGKKLLGEDSTAPYSITLSNLNSGKYQIFAKAEDSSGKSVHSAPVHFSISNAAPSVQITSPLPGTNVLAPATLNLTAVATDPDGAVKSVLFFGDGRFLGADDQAPYSLVWSNISRGTHKVRAQAVDTFGARTTSESVEFTAGNISPSVQISAPTNGTVFASRTNILIAAMATDPDDAIKEVRFYDDRHLIGVVTAAPFSITWSNAPSGRHSLSAKAIDAGGYEATSKTVKIQVGPPGRPDKD